MLSDYIEFNPRESLPKGTRAKKIAMERLMPFSRHIVGYENAEFNGGTKFRNGDVLLSRITPCLENGKTAKVSILDRDEVGFGSTEYIVLRAKEGASDPDFIYYLAISPIFRDIAIKSMIGTTGRQRVQQGVLEKADFSIPDLPTQRVIGKILSSIDDKIELNTAINTNLEEQLQAAFQSKFTANASPGLPGKLSDICHYSYAKIAVSELSLNNYYSTENMLPAKGGATRASSLPAGGQTPRCVKGDVLVSNIRPYFKKIVYAHSLGGCSPDVLCFNAAHSELSAYLFCTLYSDRFFAHMVAGTKGTKMPRGDKQQIMAYPIIVPSKDALSDFNALAFPIIEARKVLDDENKTLAKTRDVLLPKLMSGEIDVSEVEV